jgi:hypothetical protein
MHGHAFKLCLREPGRPWVGFIHINLECPPGNMNYKYLRVPLLGSESTVFLDVTPCSVIEVCWCCWGGTYGLCLQAKQETGKKQAASRTLWQYLWVRSDALHRLILFSVRSLNKSDNEKLSSISTLHECLRTFSISCFTAGCVSVISAVTQSCLPLIRCPFVVQHVT